jgi:hypothetical protein
MITSILNALFGCAHRRTTFPLSPARHLGATAVGSSTRHNTYVVCLDCGKEFAYDWKSMRIGEAVRQAPAATTTESFSPANR